MKKPLRILMVTSYPCIRALKESQALKNRGHQIILLCIPAETTKDLWATVADTIITYESLEELEAILKKITPTCDIVHGHNEPNCHTAYAIAYTVTCPVVYDCHDFSSMRSEIDDTELAYEKISFEKSDAVIHVSEALQAAADQKYDQKRSLVLYSFPPIKDVQVPKKEKLSGHHVVYEGGIVSDKNSILNYRYYIDYFSALADAKITVHIFPTQQTVPDALLQYTLADLRNKYMNIYKTQTYEALLHNMSAVPWGFTGFYRDETEHSSKTIYLDNAMPNKVFDYLIAGVTPIVINAKEVSNFVTKHNVGYSVNTMSEFIDVVKNAPPLSHNLDLRLIDMNTQITKLEELYYDLLGID